MLRGGLWPEEQGEHRRCNIELPTSIKPTRHGQGFQTRRGSGRGHRTSNSELPTFSFQLSSGDGFGGQLAAGCGQVPDGEKGGFTRLTFTASSMSARAPKPP